MMGLLNIIAGITCLWVAYDSYKSGRDPLFFAPLGVIIGVVNVSWGVASVM